MTVPFDRETWAFLDRIATDNTKATFDLLRDTYQQHVVAPSTAFVDAMATVLTELVHPDLRAEARVDRYRVRLDNADDGAVVAGLRAEDASLSGPDRAKPPRPYPADHANAELLRRDGFHLSTTHAHPPSIDSTRFPAWCATRLAPYHDLLDWLAAD